MIFSRPSVEAQHQAHFLTIHASLYVAGRSKPKSHNVVFHDFLLFQLRAEHITNNGSEYQHTLDPRRPVGGGGVEFTFFSVE